MNELYDFCGYATKNDLKCSDGRVIRKDAFKVNDGTVVPLVYNHRHDSVDDVLGHALLENRDDGVYAYGIFNKSESGLTAKQLVQNGDVTQLSIWANGLKQNGCDVVHGNIKEVSLVLAGANPGAYIDSIIMHGDGEEEEAVIYTGINFELYHSDANNEEDKKSEEGDKQMEENKSKTVQEVVDSMTDEQKDAMYYLLGKSLGEGEEENENNNKDEEGDEKMKHNVFDVDDDRNDQVLSHSAMQTIIGDAKKYGSLKESFLAHAEDYGIENIDYLFPDAKTINNTPEFIERDMEWVTYVMNSLHHTPFSRIKSVLANITEDDARAKGYFKGNLKKEEVFSLLKRTTTPTTIYKKQKLDRDDLVDITDFDVVAWLKTEMRKMLDEEIARAILVGDGRLASSDEKINETNIRPIYNDDSLYTIQKKVTVASTATDADKARAIIKGAIKARKDYKGSGNPTLFTTEDFVTDCLLLEDATGRLLYDSVEKLATALRVKAIVTVPVMENVEGKDSGTDLMGIIVNLNDYNVGADKGGAINMFDDFDIDYNQQKYLIETRCSGALTKPHSAIALELEVSNS